MFRKKNAHTNEIKNDLQFGILDGHTCGSLLLVFGKCILLGKTTEFLAAAVIASFEP